MPMKKQKVKMLFILIASSLLLSACLEKEFEELQEEIFLNNPDFKNMEISDPSIWNTLATQSVSPDDSTQNDGTKSAKSYKEYPGGGKYYYTLFEDLYPGEGDYDFNDIVIKSKLRLKKDKNSFQGTISSQLAHLGGSVTKKLGVMFYENDGKGKYQRIPNEDIQINGVWLEKGGHPYTILLPSVNENNEWEIEFSCKKGKKKNFWFSYFLITRKGNTDTQVLTSGFASVAQTQEFQVPVKDYLTNDNKPWGLEIEAKEMPIVNEKENFCKAFPEFINWVKEPNNNKYKKWFEHPDENYIQGIK